MPTTAVHRIEVHPRDGFPDPKGDAACREAAAIGLDSAPQHIEAAAVYLIEAAMDDRQLSQLADELLADAVSEQAHIGSLPPRADTIVEVHPLPGVMDPDAEAIQTAIAASLGLQVQVRTGRRYDLHGADDSTARTIAERCLANTVIHAIYDRPYHPSSFPTGHEHAAPIVEISLSDMDDDALTRLSRDAHLFLSLEEMQAIRAEYQRLGREPRDIELETLAQTWSEHCVHKTLKATIRYRDDPQGPGLSIPGLAPDAIAQRPGHERNSDGSITIHNLLKSTVAAATRELMEDGIDWCLSVFVDNAGIIAFDEEHAVCFKVETHNHPSAIEPYGGAATGIGGCIRDVIGTGLAAKPIASTDVFCVAYPDHWMRPAAGGADGIGDARHATPTVPDSSPTSASTKTQRDLPQGCLHPRRILTQVVAGVRDYGNRMGIPTVNGAVWFDDDYIGNPLVYCGSIGVMPRDKIAGAPHAGDRIMALGGRTGRDGIHGATFSSAELTDTHADEFSHAVQIGNAVTEKMTLDAILDMRDHPDGCLFNAITDCGAGGFSSAVGEMGEELGAEVQLETAPLKYAGLTPTEIWISEAQERMVLAVPSENINAVRAICARHDVEQWDLGHFGTEGRQLVLTHDGVELGRLSMDFLHGGLPETIREATWEPTSKRREHSDHDPSIEQALQSLLAHPNIASKRWIVRQYDHEVQGNAVIRPLVGMNGEGPGDAAVIMPVADSVRGLAIANGLATGLKDDPYVMTLAAIDECVRNLVCVGADPSRIAILDNFCWPSCADPGTLGSLVRAAEACYDGAMAYRTPFISGKDSLNNQFTSESGRTIRIPPTLLISGFGIVPDVHGCVTMDFKAPGNTLLLVGRVPSGASGGSHFERVFPGSVEPRAPIVDLQQDPKTAQTVFDLIRLGFIESAHDVSDGGALCAIAEMCMAGNLGAQLDAGLTSLDFLFSESPGRYVLEIYPRHRDAVLRHLGPLAPVLELGSVTASNRLTIPNGALDVPVDALRTTWLGTLDW